MHSSRTSSDQKHTKPSHCEELDSTKTAVFAVLRALKPCQKLAASEFLDALLLSTPWDVLDGLIRLIRLISRLSFRGRNRNL